MKNLKDERALSANISDVGARFFTASLTENKNWGKLIIVKKKLRDKGDKITKLERNLN